MADSNYVFDQEKMEEMVRLNAQGMFLTRGMGGVLPEQSRQELTLLHDVLDLACGPGEWVLQLAFEHPAIQAVGVDLSERMIEYAQAQAMATHLPAHFQVMNILKFPMPFEGNSFDLVNMRLLIGILYPEQWPALLAECLRLLRPGGIIRVTEFERPLSNNAFFERFQSLWADAFYRDHRSFSPDGLHYGLLPMLKPLLKRAGFEDIRHIPYMIDVSADVPEAHQAFFADALASLQVGMPYLQRMARTEAERGELERLYNQLQDLAREEDFYAYWPLMTFLGRKPRTQ
ncbi:MAG TPA: methyltransferase domain-containing protein [Ktedonobacteraceae bacterium]|nr:methyltransferase domain-containing protein [Ktedonobacteraceae bacterium]